MENYFVIQTKLPSLNDVIAKNRSNKYAGAKMKQEIEDIISWQLRLALARGHLHAVKEQCELQIDFYEKTKRRDVDNIQSSQKFILDAMVSQGILPDDSRRFVAQIHHTIFDAAEDYVVVHILPVKSVETKQI